MKIKNKSMVYFDDYGMKECHDIYAGERLTSSLFSDGQMVYEVNHGKKTASVREKAYRGTEFRFDWNEISEKDRTAESEKASERHGGWERTANHSWWDLPPTKPCMLDTATFA